MQIRELQLLYDHNEWAMDRILIQAAHLTPQEWTTPVLAHHASLRALLVHILDTEWGWRMFAQQGEVTADLVETDFPDVQTLTTHWVQERAEMHAFLNTLTDADLSDVIHRTMGEQSHALVRWHVLMHILNHTAQHRSEAAAMLTILGHSPGDLDLIWYIHRWRVMAN